MKHTYTQNCLLCSLFYCKICTNILTPTQLIPQSRGRVFFYLLSVIQMMNKSHCYWTWDHHYHHLIQLSSKQLISFRPILIQFIQSFIWHPNSLSFFHDCYTALPSSSFLVQEPKKYVKAELMHVMQIIPFPAHLWANINHSNPFSNTFNFYSYIPIKRLEK